MKKIYIIICLAFVMSCKKKTTTIIQPPAKPESFLPTTTGSTWQYQLGGIASGINNVTSTGRDTTFPNFLDFTYKVVAINSNAEDYHCRKGNDYYTVVPGSSIHKPYKIIKGDAQINEKWIGAINGTDTYYVQLLEKDILYQLDTVKFEKTWHIQQTRATANNTTNMKLDTWIGYNVGYLYTNGTIAGFPYSSKLIKAEIK